MAYEYVPTSHRPSSGQAGTGLFLRSMMIWYLEISSYSIHYYGCLRAHSNNTRIELDHVLSPAEAKLLSDHTYRYEAGLPSSRFLERDDLVKAGTARFRELEGVVLFLGRSVCAEPQRVLVGPDEFKQVTNAAYAKMEDLGYYDGGHYDEAVKVSNAWHEYFIKFRDSLTFIPPA